MDISEEDFILDDRPDGKASKNAPEGAKTPELRKRIAEICSQFVQNSIDARGDRPDRWTRNWAYYRGNIPDRTDAPHDHAPNYHFPLTKPKIDLLVASVCGGITSNEPYFTAKLYGEGARRSNEIENTLHFFLELAGFKQKIRQCGTTTGIVGKSILKVEFEMVVQGFNAMVDAPQGNLAGSPMEVEHDDGKIEQLHLLDAGLCLKCIAPENFVIYPTNVAGSISRARFVGDLVDVRRQEIWEYQRVGRYFNDSEDDLGANSMRIDDIERRESHNLTSDVGSVDIGDDAITICSGCVKLDLNKDGIEEWYNVVFTKDGEALLDIEAMDVSFNRPPYFDLTYHSEGDEFWPETSVAQDLQPLQIIQNSYCNTLKEAADASIYGVTFFNDSAGIANGQTMRFGPGDFIPTIGTPEVQQIAIHADVSTFPLMMQKVDETAESVARVSRNAQGQTQGNITATQSAQIASGSAMGLNEYHSQFETGLVPFVDYCRQLLRKNFSIIKAIYTDNVAVESADDLNKPVRWELMGKTPSQTPGARIEAARVLMETFKEVAGLNPESLDEINFDEYLTQMVDNTDVGNMDKILRTPEEVQQIRQERAQQEQMQAQAQQEAEGQQMQAQAQAEAQKMQAQGQQKSEQQRMAHADQMERLVIQEGLKGG